MKLYGLTGGIACGKSEAARRLEAQGIPVLDADRLGHDCLAPGGVAERAVVEAFGPEILTDGRIDRAKLGPMVFRDAAARERLNAIVHPCIHREIERRARTLAREGHGTALIDAALIAEDGRKPECLDGLIVVLARRETRIARLISARGLSEADAAARIDAQTPPERKAPLADVVLENDGSLEEFLAQIDALAAWIQAQATHNL